MDLETRLLATFAAGHPVQLARALESMPTSDAAEVMTELPAACGGESANHRLDGNHFEAARRRERRAASKWFPSRRWFALSPPHAATWLRRFFAL